MSLSKWVYMWYTQKFFRLTMNILLVLLILFLAVQVLPYLTLFFQYLTAIALPIIIAGVLYYILRPVREFLISKKFNPLIAVLSIYLMMFVGLALILTFIWPYISKEIIEFSNFPHEKLKEVENKTVVIMDFFNFTAIPQEQLRELLTYYLKELTTFITKAIVNNFSSIAQVASYFFITPFILFYLLKDDSHFIPEILSETPERYKLTTHQLLNDIDETLSSYINGQLIVAFIVALLILVGYWLIELKYAFLLAAIAFIFNLIPFCGPIISTVPALLIGLGESPLMAFKVIAIVLLIHLLDLNLISPRIVGPRLQIHPITIIILLVSSISLVGLIGMFLVIPVYAVLKTILVHLLNIKKAPKLIENEI